jgi:ferrochelatase
VAFDAVLVVSFGGPEGPADVMPFLRNVLRGRPVSEERLHQVAGHYLEFGGVSPINGQNRALVAGLGRAFAERGQTLPVYWGNRNWHPYLHDVVETMAADGIRRAAAFVTSAYSSYSGCRQYLEDLARARQAVGTGAPEIVKLRPYFNHPGFVLPLADGLREARLEVGPDTPVLMSAHSIPLSMAAACEYERQLRETAGLVARAAAVPEERWTLVFQSRSGPPNQPWLGPDINDAIRALDDSPKAALVAPLGFVSDHMEVVYDLDRVAAATAAARGMRFVRSRTPGHDSRFITMVCDLVEEADGLRPPSALGEIGPVSCPCRGGCPLARPEAG